jgi:hypothetical protein
MTARRIVVVLVAAVCVVALVGCSTQARAERKGKAAGDEICKAKNANNTNDAQRHLTKANNKIKDLSRFTGRDVTEDVRDLDRNLQQLSNGHGSTQDINAIVRSIDDARKSASGNALAAYDGMLEALANCD